MSKQLKEKPLGMRIGENVFCIGYLAFVLIAGIIFLSRAGATGDLLYKLCAAMTLLLGGGDAFHLIPRIIINFKGETSDPDRQRKRDFWLGLGNLISSITMTVFYLLFYLAMAALHDRIDQDAMIPDNPNVFWALAILAVIRIALCMFPQNRWFVRDKETNWGLYRNIPFVIMGIITVVCLIAMYGDWLKAALVTVSFVCYMLVVLGARRKPMLGMMMIPKTICYIWLIALFL